MANSVPTLTGLDSSTTFPESTVNATPQLIDPDVTLSDRDGNLAGGALTVTGLLPEDVVSIRNEGTGTGQIGFFAGVVTYEGFVIGQAFGGAGGTFAVTLSGGATVAAVEALIENLTYSNSSEAPTAGRTLAINVMDGDGAAAIAPRSFIEQTGAANPFAIVNVDDSSAPAFADLDGDGDLDAIVGNFDGDLAYFRNVGTASTPSFEAAGGLTGVGLFSRPSFADLDGDGDFDALVGEEDGTLHYRQNVGTATTPAFAAAVDNPFGLTDVGIGSAPSFADLDDDGDPDALVGDFDGNLHYFQNTGTASAPAFAAAVLNPFGLTNVGFSSAPSFADVDDDGDLDVVAGTPGGDLHYFENTGTASAPAFAAAMINPFGFGDVGAGTTAPSFGDFDGDGDPDLVIGEGGGGLNYFENATPPPSFETAITVTSENEAPVNIVPAAQEVEANTNVAIAGLSIVDADAGSGAMTTTLSVEYGTLTVASAGGAAVAGSGTDTVVLTGTLAQLNTTLAADGNVVYRGAQDDTLTMTTDDGGNGTDTDQVAINTRISGTAGNDSFTAPPGGTRIDGLGGSDSITFDFALVDATISYADNSITIDGPSGHTVLTGFETYTFTDGTVNEDDGNPLVADLFYYSQNHDVWNAHVDADEHFEMYGWHEGRNPNALFDVNGYLATYTDVRDAGVNPLDHYHAFGWHEGRDPSVGFDTSAYLTAYPDVAASNIDPLAHYLSHGINEGRSPFADGIWG